MVDRFGNFNLPAESTAAWPKLIQLILSVPLSSFGCWSIVHTGKLSCFLPGISTCLCRNIASARDYAALRPFSIPAMLKSSSISGQ